MRERESIVKTGGMGDGLRDGFGEGVCQDTTSFIQGTGDI